MNVRSYRMTDATRKARGTKSATSRNLRLHVSVSVADFAGLKRVAVYHQISIATVVRDYIAAGLSQDRKITEEGDRS